MNSGKRDALYEQISQQKTAFVRCILRVSSGTNVLVISEGRICSKKAKCRPNRMLLCDIKQWTSLDRYQDIKRAENHDIIIIIKINDNVYGGILMTMVTARVHAVHLMNED